VGVGCCSFCLDAARTMGTAARKLPPLFAGPWGPIVRAVVGIPVVVQRLHRQRVSFGKRKITTPATAVRLVTVNRKESLFVKIHLPPADQDANFAVALGAFKKVVRIRRLRHSGAILYPRGRAKRGGGARRAPCSL
jgi:hypothetical protein